MDKLAIDTEQYLPDMKIPRTDRYTSERDSM